MMEITDEIKPSKEQVKSKVEQFGFDINPKLLGGEVVHLANLKVDNNLDSGQMRVMIQVHVKDRVPLRAFGSCYGVG